MECLAVNEWLEEWLLSLSMDLLLERREMNDYLFLNWNSVEL